MKTCENKIKIAIYLARLQPGGIETALIALLNELIKDDSLDISLLLGCRVNYSRFEIPEDVNVIYMPDIFSAWFELTGKARGFRKLYCYVIHFMVLKFGTDFIKRKVLSNNYGKYDIAINYVNDIPGINCNFFGHEIILNCVDANKKLTWIHNDPYKLGITSEYAVNRYEGFDAIINVSKGNKIKFDQICPRFLKKSYVVYNCINLKEREEPKDKWNLDGRFHIISVSRLANEQKRIDRVIDCCEELKRRGYKDRFIWHMFGSGPDADMLRKYAEQKAVGDVLIFEGETKKSLHMMSKADIYVMTSDYEGYGLTILEALLEELPVIVTNFEEAKESVLDGKNGYLAEFDIQDICNKIEKLMNDQENRDALVKYIRENPVNNNRALEQFYELIN